MCHAAPCRTATRSPDAIARRIAGWLNPSTAAASLVGFVATLLPEWLELSVGAPAILVTFGLVVWYRGFTDDDRKLFRLGRKEEPGLPASEPATP